MAHVKICGLTDTTAVAAAVDAGADWLGFVFHPTSPRAVTVEQAMALAEPARGRIGMVALTVNADDTLIRDLSTHLRPDAIQLHGNETSERLCDVRALFGGELWKALPIAVHADLDAITDNSEADRFLLDAKPPPGADRTGGHGRAFDWTILSGWRAPKPWLLAGGLTPDTVAEAITISGANAVDVSSGVESAPGVKDPAKVRAFIQAAKERL